MVEENFNDFMDKNYHTTRCECSYNTSSRHYESNLHQATRIVIQTSQDIYFQNEIDYGYP
ncbi:hypothetical protein BSPWISOXPB_6187 [uncultured Gammaproteobacteria bacterium]|nr:hypothetical protein BSPWISOXPB_6187 [uncultured Gammaproteobacteria bacterium]